MFGLGSRFSLGLAAVASIIVSFGHPMKRMRFDAPMPSKRYRAGENRATKWKKKGGRRAWSLQVKIESVRARRRANVLRKRRERKRGAEARWRLISA